MQEFNPTVKYLLSHANAMADSLSREVPVGAVTNHHPVTENFSLHELGEAQCNHDVWSKVIDALKSGDETKPTILSVLFRQFFLSDDRVLCCCWLNKREVVAQFVIPECPTVLTLIYDGVLAGHSGK